MKYYKKLNPFGRLLWVAKLEKCTDKRAIEISKEEYDVLMDNSIDPDDTLIVEEDT